MAIIFERFRAVDGNTLSEYNFDVLISFHYNTFDLRWLYTISSVFAGSDIYISRLSGSFSPVKISGFKQFRVREFLCFAKNTVSADKPRFHGNQQAIPLLIPSLLASFKTRLSEFRAVKFCNFLCKEERNSKVSLRKVKINSVHTFGQFLQFSFLPFIAVVHA